MSIKSGRLADRHRYVLCDVDDRRDGISRRDTVGHAAAANVLPARSGDGSFPASPTAFTAGTRTRSMESEPRHGEHGRAVGRRRAAVRDRQRRTRRPPMRSALGATAYRFNALQVGSHALDHPLLAGHDAFGWGRRLFRLERLGFFGCWRLEMFVGDGGFQLLQSGGAEVDLQVFVGA